MGGPVTYKFVAADHGHETQGLHAVLLRVESLIPGLGSGVTKDHVRVHVGVEVGDALLVRLDGVCEGGDGLSIAGVAAPPVVCGTTLRTVAVYVHVGELAARALYVEDVVVGDVVATVGECLGWY